jgi:hypothetical protein
MIRLAGIILLAAFIVACNSNAEVNKVNSDLVKNPVSAKGNDESIDMPEITFLDSNTDNPLYFDFGVIIQGEIVVHTFKFKNTGNADLIIRSTSSTCGCTVSSFTKKPLAPGETGKIDVTFNSSGRSGRQHKSVNVLTNAQPASKKLVIEANVVVPN